MKNIYFPGLSSIAFFLSTFHIAKAQSDCSFTVDAGNDTIVCDGSKIQLHGSTDAADIVSISWQPAATLSDATILDPLADVTETTTYILTVSAGTGDDLVVNGDFSDGATGFITEYEPGSGGEVGPLSTQGQFDISTDPVDSHVNFASFGDHTTGEGNMLVVNASEEENTAVWCQTFAVAPFSDYTMKAWAANCHYLSPAILEFSVNGEAVGDALTLPSDLGEWTPFTATWNSGTSITADVCITDLNTDPAGNDFALDDISFSGPCSVSDTMTITLAPSPVTPVITQSADSLLIASTYSSYTWYLDGELISGADTWYHTGILSGTYTVIVTDENGCSAESLPFIIQGNAVADIHDHNILLLYPNPADDVLSVSLQTNEIFNMQLISPTGAVLYHTNSVLQSMQFAVNSFAAGIYYIIVQTEDAVFTQPLYIK